MESSFTQLERAAFAAICEMHPEDRAALEAQLSSAALLNRNQTGYGFFTYFEVDRTSCAAVGGERLRSGPAAKIDGLERGLWFILWLEQGYAHCLEGYTLDESTTGIVLESVFFEMVQKQGDSPSTKPAPS